MDKQYRKQLEQQLAVTIDYFLRKTDEKSAEKMAKYIKSTSKDLAKKFIKTREAISAKVIKDNNDIGKKAPLSVKAAANKKVPSKSGSADATSATVKTSTSPKRKRPAAKRKKSTTVKRSAPRKAIK